MEKQRFCKPWLGRFFLYRLFVGGIWRKYGYAICSNEIEGWYWTQDNYDYACKGQLSKMKEVNYK